MKEPSSTLPTHIPNTLQQAKVTLAVAPMEGIMDAIMRDILSSIGGMDYLVSEFVRVTQHPIPESNFQRLVPELRKYSVTSFQHPVHVQLLGNNPDKMAESAINAVNAGATHIDVNFGCPAKRVNGHGGGSVLLQTPDQLYAIMSALNHILPKHIPLSAKIRLGYEDEDLLFDNVAAIEDAGTKVLTVHGRTKKDGYKYPARWEKIGKIRTQSKMKVIANGDIDNIHSLVECHQITGCTDFMIGRSCLSNPFIFQDLREGLAGQVSTSRARELYDIIENYLRAIQEHYDDEIVMLGRLKQWVSYLRQNSPQIRDNLQALRQTTTSPEFMRILKHCLEQ